MAAKPKKSNAVTPEQAAKALAKTRAEQKMADQMRQGIKSQQERNKAKESAKASKGAQESLRQAKVAQNKMRAAKQGAASKMKAQGAKIMGSPTSGYGKSTKPKGK